MHSRYHVIINEKSGTVLQLGRDSIEAAIRKHLGNQLASLTFAAGKDMHAELEKILAHNDASILIGGGDGTIALSGRQCLEAGRPFGVLPLGTMNLLARDLNVPLDLTQALHAYRVHQTICMDIAEVNGHPFFCNTAIGLIPEAAAAREGGGRDNVMGSWRSLAAFLLTNMGDKQSRIYKVKYKTHRWAVRCKSLVIANNEYDQTNTKRFLHRPSLSDGKLAVYMTRSGSAIKTLSLFFKVFFGNWKGDRSVSTTRCQTLNIDCLSRELLVSIDGEPVTLSTPLHFSIKPGGATLIVPSAADMTAQEAA